MKSTIGLILGVAALVYGLYLFAISGETRYCGEILYKTEESRVGKYKVITDRTFVIYFENQKTEAVDVNLVTFIQYNEGDSICIELQNGYFDYSIGYARGYAFGGVIYTVIGILTIVICSLFKMD